YDTFSTGHKDVQLPLPTSGQNWPYSIFGPTKDAHALISSRFRGSVIDTQFFELDSGFHYTGKRWSAKTPVDARIDDLVLSPNGDRFAWYFTFTRESRLLRMLHRFIPGITAPSEVATQLWTSDLHGNNMRRVASEV